VYRTVYEYDDNDLLLTETEEYGDPPVTSYQIKYAYNEAGKQILIEWFNNVGVRDTRIEMEYDERGNLIRETTYSDAKGAVSGMHTLKYDSENRVIEDAHYLDEGTTPLYITWNEYDEKGNLIRRSINAKPEVSAARTETDEYTYDEHGRMIRERGYYLDGGEMALRTDTEKEYDENGMVTKVTHRNPDGSVSGYDYYEYVSFIVPYASLTDEEKEWFEREIGVPGLNGK
jgi:antitoxin component YwqK of YwqJK toxin-antitoxin module